MYWPCFAQYSGCSLEFLSVFLSFTMKCRDDHCFDHVRLEICFVSRSAILDASSAYLELFFSIRHFLFSRSFYLRFSFAL